MTVEHAASDRAPGRETASRLVQAALYLLALAALFAVASAAPPDQASGPGRPIVWAGSDL